ncbi:MAG: metallophosphatase family protein, partial [Nitrospirota bacterium]|nr:metallophosphatase family protein [Nitrospirota bacterium]
MRYAIISDIHGNLEAFQAVLKRIDELGVDRTLCLGDIVGYGADPNACVGIIRSMNIPSVMGNHDQVAFGCAGPERFNPAAQEAIIWTRKQLTGENREFLAALPRTITVNDLTLCHGTIRDLNRYIISTHDARDVFHELEDISGPMSICFHGHTHVPVILRENAGRIERVTADRLHCPDSGRFLVNPGSVGQPRDGDPRASFLIYDEGERT